MNVQDYIASGIIESCVLGLATDEELHEFNRMCLAHPEVAAARVAFELALEGEAMRHAVSPGAGVKSGIVNTLQGLHATPAPVMPIRRSRASSWLPFLAAAATILLAISVFWNISLTRRNAALEKQRSADATALERTSARLAMLEKDLKMIQQNPAVKMAAMKGLPAAPTAFATVYWDTASHDVYLLANNLPVPASDKQYQLWALLDGKPIDMGVIDNSHFISQEKLLIKARNVRNAQAFAITLEDKGGNPTPKGTMYVLGNL